MNVHTNSMDVQDAYQDFSFCIDVAFVKYKVKGAQQTRKHAVLMLKNGNNNKSIVHPLTAFIQWRWKYKEYNTQRLQGTHLAQFLNYLIIDNRQNYKLKSLSELTAVHGTDFLNYLLINGSSNRSVNNVERTLRYFYSFLIEKGKLHNSDITNTNVTFFSPMYSKEFAYDAEKSKVAIEHTLPPRLILMFLGTALETSPSIAFAIYLSIFGGLRAGEIVNITISDLTPYGDQYGTGGLLILLRTRNLRIDIKDTSGTSRVKRDRKQFVYSVRELLPTLFRNHLIEMHKKLGKELGHDSPLFINRDGKALTGKSLRDAFGKVKKNFLHKLSSSRRPDDMITAINLQSTKWSFHIGRGTFTNLLAKKAKNPYDIALPRGDKSITSSLAYMSDTEEMKKCIEELINSMYKE
ncbi:site-specific integrase [Paenibacillus chitinolyticus]|uniref:tyrosine-type recombinase/integrase n=1 Tax=Paenibacillus chitinolyticus TaxID=79263 RepID=UPI002DBECA9A|nr:site-specific integrase [Paenibacillus chitinolyticus]MEC0247271.1 site-specific integrase [Paenibacillus chitinolyticus]